MDNETRDRVRALVRDVLANALPADEADANDVTDSSPSAAVANNAPAPRVENVAPVVAAPAGIVTRFIDVAPVQTENAVPVRDESAKSIITETDVRDLPDGAQLRISDKARLTPLAADIIRERNIELLYRAPHGGSENKQLSIAVGADHGGFPLKEALKKFLGETGYSRVRDFGTNSTDAVDYPDFAHAVASAVADKTADVGIVIDGAGIGSAMTANKVPGVRAAACYTVALAKNSREHNGANVLTLGSGTISEVEMREIVAAWLGTDLTEARHRKRVEKIVAVERQYQR